MKAVTEFERVYLHREPVDFRKAINGLSEIVQFAGMGDLRGRNLFVFCSKRRDRIKILYFDRSGFALWQKRLESERFVWPRKFAGEVIHISTEQLAWLLEGYDITRMRRFKELEFEKVC